MLKLQSGIELPDEADLFVQSLHEEEQCVLATSDDAEGEGSSVVPRPRLLWHQNKQGKQYNINVVKKYPFLPKLQSQIERPDEADIFVQPLQEEEQCVLATSDDTEEEHVTTSSQSSQQRIPEKEISI